MQFLSDLLWQSLLFVSVLRLPVRYVPQAVRPGPVPDFRCGCRGRPTRHHGGRFITGSEGKGMGACDEHNVDEKAEVA